MKNRIEQLLNGTFEYEVPGPVLSVERLDLTARTGETLRGQFTVSHPREKRIKGFLYSSNPRVSIEPQEFYGAEVKISYQADTTGLDRGEKTEGLITLCTDLGEAVLPVEIQIETEKGPAADIAAGSTDELCRLAGKDFQKAYPVFVSSEFAQVVRDKEKDRFALYEALTLSSVNYQSMEEYLIGTGYKDPVELTMEKEEYRSDSIYQSVRETISLHKEGWGFLRLDVSSDSLFLRPEKKTVTTDDFLGNQYQLEYIIDTNFLHAGINHGRIRIRTCYQTMYFDVTIHRKGNEAEHRTHHVRKLMQQKLLLLYLEFRMKRTDMQTWIDRSQNVISSYRRAGGKDVMADLLQVQLLFADDKKSKALRLLQEIEEDAEQLSDPQHYAFYLYITTFFQKDASYVDQVEARIEQIFLQNRDNWVIQWILLYLQERMLRDDNAKMEAITEQIRLGCSSPIMYLEAVWLIRKNPFLMHKLDSVELKLLLFAARWDMITEEIAHQTGNLALYHRQYSRQLFRVLKECYRVAPSDDILKAICMILIAGDCKDSSYFQWYALGVERELRITGLYEYYMETMDQNAIESMPQVIRMYFIYNSTLNYHKRAAIYRSISEKKDSMPQVYRSCRAAVEQFVLEQAGNGRIDENLAYLYENYLTRTMLNKKLADRLLRLLFTFRVTCKNPSIRSVVVVHRRMKGEQLVPLINGEALVQIYTDDARILLEDEQGGRYASTSLYMAERLLDSPELLADCMELVQDHSGMVLYMLGVHQDEKEVTSGMLGYLKQVCSMQQMQDWEQEQAKREVLQYYLEHPEDDSLQEWLRQISYSDYVHVNKRTLMTLLTREDLCGEAFELLRSYGCEQVNLQDLVRICSQQVLAAEYEENGALLAYCSKCFEFGRFDENILNYLLMYYDGPIEEMKRLWNTGKQYDLDIMMLEEKILSLILFTRSGSSGTEQIYVSYQRKLGNKKICRAYLILKCYEYFVRGLPVHDLIFEQVENGCRKESQLEDVCRLALLQHYSGRLELQDWQKELAVNLLDEYQARGMRFAFYQSFPAEIREPYQLDDRVFLEYVADPESTVTLYYRLKGRQEEYQEELMNSCFAGIYVKEFILFYGDEVECFIRENSKYHQERVSDHRILTAKRTDPEGTGRYELLNRISKELQEGNTDAARERLMTYHQLDKLTLELFTLI